MITLHKTQSDLLKLILDDKIRMRANMYIDSVTMKRIDEIYRNGFYWQNDKQILNTLLKAYNSKELR